MTPEGRDYSDHFYTNIVMFEIINIISLIIEQKWPSKCVTIKEPFFLETVGNVAIPQDYVVSYLMMF